MDKAQAKEDKRAWSLIAWLFGRSEEDNSVQIKKDELRKALDNYEQCLKKTKLKLKGDG